MASAPPPPHTVHEGWLLKKRRRKMQGFARRYFSLDSTGLLSYSFEPGQPSRDKVHLAHASISWTPGRKDITVDTNAATFHIKCITAKDYTDWMAAIRQYISDDGLNRRRMSLARASSRGTRAIRAALLNEELAESIKELDTAVAEFQGEEVARQSHFRHKSTKSERRHGDKSRDVEKESGHKFGIFRKSYHSHASEHPSEASQDDDVRPTLAPDHPNFKHFERINVLLDILKAQQLALSDALRALNQMDHSALSQSFGHSHGLSVSSPIAEEGIDLPTPRARTSTSTAVSSQYKRSSTVFTEEGSSIFFDAEEGGPEEFVLEAAAEEQDDPSWDLEATRRDSQNSIEPSRVASIEDKREEVGNDGDDDIPAPIPEITRRNVLPSGPVGDEGSLFSILKKNVGKDLATIALPASFNEPLTLLERCAEEVEYYDVLNQAAASTDPMERLCLVATFAMSGYAHTRYRSGRKGFTPLLGETFEDPRMKFIAEKVSHHPLVMAYHAEGSGWELTATSSGKTKFWGKSLEIIPTGQSYARIGDDVFTWKKPSSFMRNLMIGSKYLEHCGDLIVENTTTKARCVLEFKEAGYWGSSSNVVTGKAYLSEGNVVAHLEGKWDEQLSQKLDSSHFKVLWRAAPYPYMSQEFYGFTAFGITLNEITEDIQNMLPPTDSRYRPDVRALEKGNLDDAEKEKMRLEEEQRVRRQRKLERDPRWFKMINGQWTYVGGYWEERARGWDEVEPLF